MKPFPKIPDHDEEIWKDIPGYEELYQASTLGRIKSLKRPFQKEIIKKQKQTKDGYLEIDLSKKGIRNFIRTHRLILFTFKPENQREQVNHKDGDKKNNNINNLEWCTCQENIEHS